MTGVNNNFYLMAVAASYLSTSYSDFFGILGGPYKLICLIIMGPTTGSDEKKREILVFTSWPVSQD